MCEGELQEVAHTEEDGPTRTMYECWNKRCPEYKRPFPISRVILDGEGQSPLEIPPTEPARDFGVKLDNGKPLVYTEFLRQFPRAIRLVARVGERGTQAPGHVRSGWKSVAQGYERYSDAFARHILREAMLATDAEPTSPDPMHDLIWEAATVCWNDLARLEHLVKQNQAAAERIDGDPLA